MPGEPVPQARLMGVIMPRLHDEGARYRKATRIHARPAVEHEVVVSITEAGEETSNTAKPDEMVVRNLTRARELYLVGRDTFDERYRHVGPVDETWTVYEPTGEILALEITHAITSLLDVDDEFLIMAPWGSEQQVHAEDYLVSPLPGLTEIYRVARAEFDQTYRLAE